MAKRQWHNAKKGKQGFQKTGTAVKTPPVKPAKVAVVAKGDYGLTPDLSIAEQNAKMEQILSDTVERRAAGVTVFPPQNSNEGPGASVQKKAWEL